MICTSLLKRLYEIEQLVNQVSVPLAFADVFDGLGGHVNLVRQCVTHALEGAASAARLIAQCATWVHSH